MRMGPRLGLTAAIVLVAACGGGGGGGGGGGPTQPEPGISYGADAGSSSAQFALLEGAGGTATTLRLELRAQQVVGLYGVAFDLLYPSNLFTLVAATDGGFLGGVNTSFQVRETQPGRIVVGLSRLGNTGGVSGSGVLVRFEFASRGAAGSGDFDFSDNDAFDTLARPIAGVSWSGGAVVVTP